MAHAVQEQSFPWHSGEIAVQERLGDLDPGLVQVRTFHALGFELIGEAYGEKPPISKLASDPRELEQLAARSLVDVLVEGGGALLGSFFDARVVDEVHVR